MFQAVSEIMINVLHLAAGRHSTPPTPTSAPGSADTPAAVTLSDGLPNGVNDVITAEAGERELRKINAEMDRLYAVNGFMDDGADATSPPASALQDDFVYDEHNTTGAPVSGDASARLVNNSSGQNATANSAQLSSDVGVTNGSCEAECSGQSEPGPVSEPAPDLTTGRITM